MALQLFLAVGVDRQTEMVFAEYEMAAGESVHGQIQLLDLADAAVAGADHHALGALQHLQALLACMRREGMRQHVFHIQVLEAVEHAGPGLFRIVLELQHGTIVIRAIGCAHDEITAGRTEDMARYRQAGMDRATRQGHRLVQPVDQPGTEAADVGEQRAVRILLQAEPAGSVIVQHGFDMAGQFLDACQGLLLLGAQRSQIGSGLQQAPAFGRGAVQHAEVERVLHQLAAGQGCEVLIRQLLVEGIVERRLQVQLHAAAHIVHPERDIGVFRGTQALQQAVEGLVPTFEFGLFTAGEWQAIEPPAHQVVATSGLDHFGRDMAGQRDMGADGREWFRAHGLTPAGVVRAG